jgi:hypothetical protein
LQTRMKPSYAGFFVHQAHCEPKRPKTNKNAF